MAVVFIDVDDAFFESAKERLRWKCRSFQSKEILRSQEVVAQLVKLAPDLVVLDERVLKKGLPRFVDKVRKALGVGLLPVLVLGDEPSATLEDTSWLDFLPRSQDLDVAVWRMRFLKRAAGDLNFAMARQEDLFEMTSLLRALNKEWEKLSYSDPLTNLPNRRYFEMSLDNEWKRAKRAKSSLSLLMLDIDHFKSFNDRYGHATGDDCLQELAGVLRECVKRPGDFIARFGGEEFIALLPHTDAAGAQVVAEEMRRRLASRKIPVGSGKYEKLTISIGVAGFEFEEGLEPTQMLELVDKALYEAKEGGRNRVVSLERGGPKLKAFGQAAGPKNS